MHSHILKCATMAQFEIKLLTPFFACCQNLGSKRQAVFEDSGEIPETSEVTVDSCP